MTSTTPAAAAAAASDAATARSAATTGPGRRLVPVAAALLGGTAAVLAGLAITQAAAPSLLYDPGALVRWGLPIVTMVGDLAAATTLGVLVLTAVALPVGPKARANPTALHLVTVASVVWTLAVLLQFVLQYAQTSGSHLDDPRFGEQLAAFLRDSEPGRGFAATIAVAGLLALASAATSRVGTVGLLVLLGVVGLVPPSLAGHSSGLSDHETAVTSLGLHLLGVCVWTGGLVGLILLRARLGEALPTVARRYSTLTGWAFVLVGVSGLINAAIRVPRLQGLATSYGLLLGLKAGAFVVLGVAGWQHRRRTLPAVDDGRPGAFARLAAGELVVMGMTFGLAAALAASPTPDSGRRTLATLAESVTGYPMPPPSTPMRWLTQWEPDLLWGLVAVLAAVGYLVGVRRLHARGDRWSPYRTVSWLVGVAALVYVTSGPPMVYGRVLFSAHMVGHMSLSMLVPIFLVLGAPVTLALRALTPRGDGSRGPREWLLAAVESRYTRILSFPPVAAFLFAGSLVFFYFSPLFGLALRTHVGHELMHVHFLAAGYLFTWVLVGIDPGPRRVNHPLRLITLLAAMAFHAFFGVTLLSGETVLEAGYFGGLGRTWGGELLADQRVGGGVAWGIGDIPAIVLAVIIAIQWAVSDDREARRQDRAADRDGGAELNAYNEMLARMAERDRRA
jgi:cytochrome c oxidase assembly factor CtaG/putative copper export protein